jgi:hypothetical protein
MNLGGYLYYRVWSSSVAKRVSSKEAQARDPFLWSVLLPSETLIARQSVLVIRRSEASQWQS